PPTPGAVEPLPTTHQATPLPRQQMRMQSTAELLNIAPPSAPPPTPSGGANGRPSLLAPSDGAPRGPAPPTFWQRLLRIVTFWRQGAHPIACTLLSPPSALPGETITLQVIAHHANRSQQARVLEDWRGTAPLPG